MKGRHKSQKKVKRIKANRLVAASQKTQISHLFENLAGWEVLIKEFADEVQRKIQRDLTVTVPFWNWLQQQTIELEKNCVIWTLPSYRIVYGGRDPLSIAGTLSDGGRYNIGGAQEINFAQFSTLKKSAALYMADTVNCGIAEAGEFSGAMEIYRLTCNKTLQLWNIDSVCKVLGRPDLEKLIFDSPFSARWILQKAPLIPQILGMWLRSKGGDGIISPSTRDQNGKIICLFIDDDKHSKSFITAEKIENASPAEQLVLENKNQS